MTGKKSKLKLASSLGVVFFVGVVAGALAASLYFEARIEKMFRSRPPHGEEVIERLTEDLNLTPEQQREIRPIIMAFEKKASELRTRFQPQMRHLHDQVTAQIRTKLNEEQKQEFDTINRRLEKRFQGKAPFPTPPTHSMRTPEPPR